MPETPSDQPNPAANGAVNATLQHDSTSSAEYAWPIESQNTMYICSVFMYICVYIFTHTHTHTHTHTRVNMYVCMQNVLAEREQL